MQYLLKNYALPWRISSASVDLWALSKELTYTKRKIPIKHNMAICRCDNVQAPVNVLARYKDAPHYIICLVLAQYKKIIRHAAQWNVSNFARHGCDQVVPARRNPSMAEQRKIATEAAPRSSVLVFFREQIVINIFNAISTALEKSHCVQKYFFTRRHISTKIQWFHPYWTRRNRQWLCAKTWYQYPDYLMLMVKLSLFSKDALMKDTFPRWVEL